MINFICESIILDLTALKSALAVGFPVVIGIKVYESFESDQVARTGIVSLPKLSSLSRFCELCNRYVDWKIGALNYDRQHSFTYLSKLNRMIFLSFGTIYENPWMLGIRMTGYMMDYANKGRRLILRSQLIN